MTDLCAFRDSLAGEETRRNWSMGGLEVGTYMHHFEGLIGAS
jgi:hypothetical protein